MTKISFHRSGWLVASLVIAFSAFATDGERPDEPKPAEVKPEPKAPDTRNVRIIKPFSALTDLTADQTEKMKQIHRKYLDQIKALEAKQHEELMAVLSDDQKKELLDAEAKEKIAKKVASAKSKEKGAETNGKPADSAGGKTPSP